MKKRLDIALVERGFAETRSKACALIMAGKVKVNGLVRTKAGFALKEGDEISIVEDLCPYVSRGGLKLEFALKHFKVSVENRICLDIGVATGGFSDCLIKHGAKLVYAVDVGKGQLDSSLAKNPKIKFIPHTNAKYLKPKIFCPLADFAAIDVSFISLRKVLIPVINCLKKPASIIALIKPQFELEAKKVPKGIVKEENYRKEVVENLQNFLKQVASQQNISLTDKGVTPSPIKGAKGNIEYLWQIAVS
jgi:23S rRNA (cytidine1920-2'-O)/16S rRNA (cytidine1409-2'-O)-methyltransferase